MRSPRFLCGVAAGAALCLLVGEPGAVAAQSGDGYQAPDPPYDAPAAVVTVSWELRDDVVVLYDATTSEDPTGDWTDGDYAGWGGGCEPGAVTGDEVLPLFLGGGPSEAYYDELPQAPPEGHGAYNWSGAPGTYTIVAAANGYCVNPGAEGTERAQELYESVLPPGRTFTVAARVERYEAGSTAPVDVETFSADIPMQLSVETTTVIGQVTVDPPADEATSPEEGTTEDQQPVPSITEAPTSGRASEDDPALIRWLLDPMLWFVAALLFGVAVMLGIFRAVLRGLRPWTPTHAVSAGSALTEVRAPGDPTGTTGAPLIWGQVPGGGHSVTQDTSVRLVRAVAGTDEVIVEFRDGTRARTNRRSLESLETSPSTFRPSHRLVGDEIRGWSDRHDPGVGTPDACVPVGGDQPVEVVRTKGPYTLVRYGYGGRYRMWVLSDNVQVRVHRPAATARPPVG
ncbi:MAG: hypothetical protein MUF83_13075 [Acidimicrobiales bacterium]|nr:hypothetical protein [Acidimicrobiales bacterium]